MPGLQLSTRLHALADEEYRLFQMRLLPTLKPELIWGVRMPNVRALAREWDDSAEAQEFLSRLPHAAYDENNLHAALLERIRDFDACAEAVNAFLPQVDNWATCDMLSPPVFRRQPERLLPWIQRWLRSDHVYTVRYGLGMLMRYFLRERFDPAYLHWAATLPQEEYYVSMMVAWYLATALAHQYEAALPYFTGALPLDRETRRRALRKALESNRIDAETKAILRALP